MNRLSMTFRVDRDKGISHQVTHLTGTDIKGITLFISEYDYTLKQDIKSEVTISVAEFKRNNVDMFNDMVRRKKSKENIAKIIKEN